MAIVRCEECEKYIDLGYHIATIVWVDDKPYHWQCAMNIGKVEEEEDDD